MLRAVLTRGVLAAVATAVGLGLAEGAARVLAPHWMPQHTDRRFWSYHEVLGWTHVPGQTGTMRHPDFEVEVTISEQGLRDRVYPYERVPGRRRMLALGDSFAWGFGVEREEILWEILESRHPDWEIINGGVSGWGTDQQYLWLERQGLRFRPDRVVLLFHPNDLEDNADLSRYGYRKPRFVLEEGNLELTHVPVNRFYRRERLQRWLKEHSYLWNGLRRAGWTRLGPGVARAAGPRAAGPPVGGPVTRALLEALHARVEAAGAELAVVSVPGPDYVPPFLRDVLEPLGVPYLPLDDAFRGVPREEYKFPNDPHWNASGQRIAADAVEAFLVELGWLP